jgi:hypothetical protein
VSIVVSIVSSALRLGRRIDQTSNVRKVLAKDFTTFLRAIPEIRSKKRIVHFGSSGTDRAAAV